MRLSEKFRWDFSAEAFALPALIVGKATIRTVVRIEVFFAPGDPWQKNGFIMPALREKSTFSTN